MPNARIKFSNDLIDLNQPASLKVIETDGKFQICLILGIKAQKIVQTDPGELDRSRDTRINTEMFLTGRANIGLKKKGSNDATSIVSIAFDGDVDTKVPGTGAFILPFKFEEHMLDFEPTPEHN